MQIVQTQISEEGGSNPAIRVEFKGAGGEVVSVLLRKTGETELTRDEAVSRAQEAMLQVSDADRHSAYEQTYESQSNGNL